MQNKVFKYLAILGLVISSCDSNRIFDEYKTVPNQWHKDSIVEFEITPPDSTNAYNLFVNLRNTSEYKYSNLFLIVEMNFPNGKKVKDTLEYQMAKPSGEFLGTGFSDVKENETTKKDDGQNKTESNPDDSQESFALELNTTSTAGNKDVAGID